MTQLTKKPSFPGFETALNPESVCTLLERALQKKNSYLKVTDCKVSDVKYDPKKQCSILYKVEFCDTFFNRSWNENISARVLKNGEIPNFNSQPFHISEDDGIAFFLFPTDPMMSWLPDMLSEELMIEQLNRHWAKNDLKVKKMETSLLCYTPQMRATFEYNFELEDRKTGEKSNVSWVGKTNFFKPPHLNHAKHYAIWKAAENKISISKPIDFLIHPRVAFQQKVNGEKLGSFIDSPNFEKHLKETARTIAHFHSLQVPIPNARSIDSEIASLTRWSNILMSIRQDLKPRIEKLFRTISSELESRITATGPVHADFHPSNILVDGDKIHLIDLDEMAFGDPCSDIGRFLSSLRIPSLRMYGTVEGLFPAREAFLECYLEKTGADRQKIHLFESASLLTSAGSAFRLQRPNWMKEVLLLIEESEKAFEKSLAKGTNGEPPKYAEMSLEDRLEWVKDETLIFSHLTPHFKNNWDLDLIECAFSRVKKSHSGYQVTYRTISWKEKTKVRKKIAIFLPKKKVGKQIFSYLKKQKGESILEPLAFIRELEAVVTDYQPKQSLSHLILQSTLEP